MPEETGSALVTRPEPGASELARALSVVRGLKVFKAPLLRIESTGEAPSPASGANALLITSPQAIPYTEGVATLPVYAVGDASAQAARAAGLHVAAVGPGVADHRLIEAIPQETNLLHLCGVHLSSDLAGPFDAAGISYTRIAVYEAKQAEGLPAEGQSFLHTDGAKRVLLFSARTAEAFARAAGPHHRDLGSPPLTALCASERVAAAAKALFPFEHVAVTGSTDTARFIDFLTARRT